MGRIIGAACLILLSASAHPACSDPWQPTDLELRVAYCLTISQDWLTFDEALPQVPHIKSQEASGQDLTNTIEKMKTDLSVKISHLRNYLLEGGYPGSIRPIDQLLLAIAQGHSDFMNCSAELRIPNYTCYTQCNNIKEYLGQQKCFLDCQPRTCQVSGEKCNNIELDLPY